jgi:SAM-dependent methyltransferase
MATWGSVLFVSQQKVLLMRLSDSQIISFCEQYMHGSDHPDQIGYRKQAAQRDFLDKKLFLERQKILLDLGDFRGKRILDVGCGFGWYAFVFSLLGNNSVIGLDILPGMIEGMNESIATMKAKGVVFDTKGICGDICQAPLDPHSFDAIYSIEAIEHVHDLDAMFARCWELLKPGGKLILVNDNNIYHHETREEIIAMWQEREHSWDWVEKLKNWRPVEHANAKPFAVMREEIVRAANQQLDDNSVTTIVAETAGLLNGEIEDIARCYKPGFQFPALNQYDRCRNPETGEYAERLLDPFHLAGMLRKKGFGKTQVRHYFRRFPLAVVAATPLTLQYIGFDPTLLTSTTVPVGSVPLLSAVVTVIGVPRAPLRLGVKPPRVALNEPAIWSGFVASPQVTACPLAFWHST